MASKFQTVRGTKDLYGADLQIIKAIENIFITNAVKYGFNEIRTPIIEALNLFSSGVGELTDIVNKEMYVFDDKGGDKLVLRPENTASIVRAMICNGLEQYLPLKYYYIGPMFRYERPQQGRFRQFHQVGVEYLGTNDYSSDLEVILLAIDFLKSLRINKYKLLLNTLGSKESLVKYSKELKEYYKANINNLSQESIVRLEKNPVRILDSKDNNDIEVNARAPKLINYLSNEDINYYNKIKESLNYLGIEYTEDYSLVRGLDYYSHTVFEFISDEIGAKSTIIGGGRYNNLIKQLGGPNVGAVGFAGGIERLAALSNVNLHVNKQIGLVCIDEVNTNYAIKISNLVKELGFSCSLISGSNASNKLKKASNGNYYAVVIVGEKEEQNNTIELKDLETFTQQTVTLLDLKSVLLFKYANNIV